MFSKKHPQVLVLAFFILILGVFAAQAKSSSTGSDAKLSFLVLGDNRLPGYLPFTTGQTEELNQFVDKNYSSLVLKEAQYNQAGMLEMMLLCPEDDPTTGCKTCILKDGWPNWLVDTAQTPSLILRGDGQTWVYDSIVRDSAALASDRDVLILHTGDIVYNGYYGTDAAQSPYWKRFKDNLFDRLPAGSPKGLPGRFFPTIGNHETWMDKDAVGVRTTVGYLDKVGLDQDNHMYNFKLADSLFVFLDTGGYPPKSDWGNNSLPSFENQMGILDELLKQGKKEKSFNNVFVVLHKPPFVASGHGHLSKEKNPHTFLKEFSNDFDITVFSGHVHSTEAYLKDNIRYFVLGGGGADQSFMPHCETGDYYCSDELYWKGAQRKLEYNYMAVTVDGGSLDFTLNRWRPAEAKAFKKCTFTKQDNELTFQCQ